VTMTDRPFNLKPEDQPAASPVDDDDIAIALDVKDLGAIEAQILMLNGFLGESRLATRAALHLLAQGSRARRLLYRSLRAQDDALKAGLAVVTQTREL
jgi:hypothetical protein